MCAARLISLNSIRKIVRYVYRRGHKLPQLIEKKKNVVVYVDALRAKGGIRN